MIIVRRSQSEISFSSAGRIQPPWRPIPFKKVLVKNTTDFSAVAPRMTSQRAAFEDTCILKEDGSNFSKWKAHLHGQLVMAEFAWETIEGELDPEDETQRQNYLIGNKNAYSTIINSLEENTRTRILLSVGTPSSGIISAKDVYDEISRHFKPRFLQVWNRLTNFEFNPRKSIGRNVSDFRDIWRDFAEVGFTGVTEEDIGGLLLHKLPARYHSVRFAWWAGAERDLTALTRLLIQEEAHHQWQSTRNIVCWSCRGRGHRSVECRSRN